MVKPIERYLDRNVHCILGLPFDAISLNSTIDIINDSIVQKKPCFLSTPNLNFAIATQSDNAFFQSVVDSDLSIADGMPLIWVAKLLGIPISERVAGSTLFDELSKQENHPKKIKVFFFGGQEGIAELAHHKLNENSAGMMCCGFYDPGFVSIDKMSMATISEYINSCEPDFIVVALGAKKGQKWIQNNKNLLNAPIISHLGAVINFVAGNIDRAPIKWQRFGLEWLWRIRQEPALWKRYLFDGLAFLRLIIFNVLPLACYDRIWKRTASYNKISKIKFEQKEHIEITLEGSIHHAVMQQFKQNLESVIEEYHGDVVIDCEQLTYIDSAFIATLLLFQSYLRKQERSLALSNVPSRIRKTLCLSSVIRRFRLI